LANVILQLVVAVVM